jgi:hypothetical protein
MHRSRSSRPRYAAIALPAALIPFVALAAAAASEGTPGLHLIGAASASEGGEVAGFDPFDLIFLCVPGYFLLQVALARGTSGWWRRATLLPAVIMVPILAYTVLAFAARSNLWPMLMLLSAPLAFVYLVVLTVILLLRRVAKAF